MKLTMQIKLLPTPEQARLLDVTMQEYISCVNDILDYAIAIDGMPKLSSARVYAPLPATLRGQCCLDAKSIYYKTLKHGGKFPTLKKPVAIWNNQNYTVGTDFIAMPFFKDGQTKKQAVSAVVPEAALEKLSSCKLGTLRVTRKNGKYIAQIAYEAQEAASAGTEVMGIDLGIKCPAVAKISDGTTRFYGNGRQNKYVRRRFAKHRKKLGKAKK